jgi:ABC-type iron transport system FetAB permease component
MKIFTLQAFKIMASRMHQRRLNNVAAYNVAEYISCCGLSANKLGWEAKLIINSLKKLVKLFIITFSADYIFA